MLRVSLIVVALGAAIAPVPASLVEMVYSRQLYLAGQNLLTPVSNTVGFVVFDVLLLGVLVGVPLWWGVCLWRAGRDRRSWGRVLLTTALDTVTLAAVLYLVFLVVWGGNYRREPLAAKLDFERSAVSPQALSDLTVHAVTQLNRLHGDAHSSDWASLEELPQRMGGAFEAAQSRLGAPRSAAVPLPKVTWLTSYFRAAGIDGMISPFSLEVLINGHVLPFERPFVVAHEWAHAAGYADEAEASFVGWLTCMEGDSATKYSGWLSLTPRLMRNLDPSDQAAAWEMMSEGPLEDLRAVSARVSAVVPVVRRNANRVYDGYLRANRVESGIASYGLVVDLVLGTRLGARVALGR